MAIARLNGRLHADGPGDTGPQRVIIQGTQGADTLTGSDDNDEIYAYGGDDLVQGQGGNDFINGGDGDDRLLGGEGNDTLLGGNGSDVLHGGGGDDVFNQSADSAVDLLIGGAGADRFTLNLYAPSSTIEFPDLIADFSTAEGDRLDLNIWDGVYSGDHLRFNGALEMPLAEGDTAPGGGERVTDIWTWFENGQTVLLVDRNDNDRLDATDLLIRFEGQILITRESFMPGTFVAQFGTPGDDIWTGGEGADLYFGGTGNDAADGAGGDDEIFGGEGDDTLTGSDGDDYLVGEEGSDTLRGGAGDDTLYAAFVTNTWRTDAGSTNRLYGEEGNDRLIAGDGRDILDGGDGDDILSSRDDDRAIGGDELYGGAGNDRFDLNGDLADGGSGDDFFLLGRWGSTVTGGTGADLFQIYPITPTPAVYPDSVSLILDFNAGEGDRLDYTYLNRGAALGFRGQVENPGFALSLGTRYSDNEELTPGVRQIWTWYDGTHTWMMADVDRDGTLSSADYVMAFLGQVTLTASAFTTDSLNATLGTMQDNIWEGTADPDAYYGLGGEDIIRGNAGADSLYGGGGDDVIDGGDGNDLLDGGTGVDRMYGGTGDDHYFIDTQADLIFETDGQGFDRVTASTSFYLYDGLEELILLAGAGDAYGVGNALNNYLTGNSGQNLLIGGAGNDVIDGGSGNDSLFGEDGDDRLTGGSGIDYLVGGAGNDVLYGGVDADALYGGDGDDVLWGGGSFHTDILVGGAGNDILRGDSLSADYDLLDGDEGDDLYWVDTGDDLTFEDVGGGVDTVYADVRWTGAGVYLYANVENLVLVGTTAFGVGNEMDNLIVGSASENWLLGGAGDDVLTGGGGNDVLFGEAGADVFAFTRGTGTDVIGDFTIGSDRIDLRDHGFTSFGQLAINFGQVGSDGSINLRNGDIIVLHGVTMADLTAADFIFLGQDSPAEALASIIPADDPRFSGWRHAPPEESGGKDALGPQVLPGLDADDFIVGKAALDAGPQVLPGAGEDLFGLDALPDGLSLRMELWAARGDDVLSDTSGDLPLALQPENDWGWA
jgi:Ca2+-binding RTX toxin-like protein